MLDGLPKATQPVCRRARTQTFECLPTGLQLSPTQEKCPFSSPQAGPTLCVPLEHLLIFQPVPQSMLLGAPVPAQSLSHAPCL